MLIRNNASHLDSSGAGDKHAGKALHGGGLSGTIHSDVTNDFTIGDIKGDVLECLGSLVIGLQQGGYAPEYTMFWSKASLKTLIEVLNPDHGTILQ